jgi:glycosyltransferase involved in cell wall biosynthesis
MAALIVKVDTSTPNMSCDNIQLSICIATLNRAAFIGATLDSLISQVTDEVEIVIVDGASTDNTAQVVQQYQRQFPRLRYVRLAAKGGVDQDYSQAVELAQGEYCWLMTDDDLLKPGAVAAVLEATRRPYGLIIVNAEVRNADLTRVLARSRLPFGADRVYQPTEADRARLLTDAGNYLSFIGGVVIKRQLWNARDKARYFGTEFVHVGVIFQSPLPEATLALAHPWIMIRYGNAQWTPRSFEIWMFKWPNLIWSLPGFSDAARRRVSSPEPWRRAWALLLFRARGAYSTREYQAWIAPRPGSAWSKWSARLIARLPGGMVNLFAMLYAWVRRYQPLQVDLRNSPFFYRQHQHGLLQRSQASHETDHPPLT